MKKMAKRNIIMLIILIVIFFAGIMTILVLGKNSIGNNKSLQNTVIDIEKNIYKLNTVANL